MNRWAWNPRRSLLCTVSYSIAVSGILQLVATSQSTRARASGTWVIGPHVEAGCAALRYYMSIANLPPLLPSPLCVHAPPRRTRSGSTRPPAGTANANEYRKRIEQPSRVHPSPRLCFCTLYSVLCSLESRVHPRTGSLRAHASPLRVAFTPMPEPGGFVVFTPFRIAFHACHAMPRHATPCLTHHAMSSARAVSILAPPLAPSPRLAATFTSPLALHGVPFRDATLTLHSVASRAQRERGACAAPEPMLELAVVGSCTPPTGDPTPTRPGTRTLARSGLTPINTGLMNSNEVLR